MKKALAMTGTIVSDVEMSRPVFHTFLNLDMRADIACRSSGEYNNSTVKVGTKSLIVSYSLKF